MNKTTLLNYAANLEAELKPIIQAGIPKGGDVRYLVDVARFSVDYITKEINSGDFCLMTELLLSDVLDLYVYTKDYGVSPEYQAIFQAVMAIPMIEFNNVDVTDISPRNEIFKPQFIKSRLIPGVSCKLSFKWNPITRSAVIDSEVKFTKEFVNLGLDSIFNAEFNAQQKEFPANTAWDVIQVIENAKRLVTHMRVFIKQQARLKAGSIFQKLMTQSNMDAASIKFAAKHVV